MNVAARNSQVVFESRTIQGYSVDVVQNEYLSSAPNRMVVLYNFNKDFEREIKKIHDKEPESLSYNIASIIDHDEYIDGELSRSAMFMKNALKNKQMDNVMEALMRLYMRNLTNTHVLEGILVMLSSVPYDAVAPKGQVIVAGLVSNEELLIRDRAIQCYECWNSKKGLNVLRSLNCQPKWLQAYVDQIILDIEKDGVE